MPSSSSSCPQIPRGVIFGRRAPPEGEVRVQDIASSPTRWPCWVALPFAVTRGIVPADRDLREGQICRDGKNPYQRYRTWELAGPTIGLVGLGAVRTARRISPPPWP